LVVNLKNKQTQEVVMKIRIKYRRARFTVEAERKTTCEVCGKGGKIDFHHCKYAYKTSEVRKNPQLALENTAQLCYNCHRIADCIRMLAEHPEDTRKAQKLLDDIVAEEKARNSKE